MHDETPKHFALQYRITNDPNPLTPPVACLDGGMAKLVMVDDTSAPYSYSSSLGTNGLRAWFPRAANVGVAARLMKRLVYEGNVLPILTALSFTLLAEMYTTTSAKDSLYRRVRLQYKSTPIADFGIARGAAIVQPQDRLAYYKTSNGSIVHGQNPDEHYWLWFRTVRGHEVTLDLSMFTFNMGVMVDLRDYFASPFTDFVPAYFRERNLKKAERDAPEEALTDMHRDGTVRVSVLRDEEMHEAVHHSHDREDVFPDDRRTIGRFMQRR